MPSVITSYSIHYTKLYDENLKKTLSEDGLSDKTKDLIAELQKKTEVDIESVMAHSQDEINQLLRQEIVKRYYYQKGEIQEMLKDDSGVRKAIEVLQNPTEYSYNFV